jgi:hypothetical protein
MQKENQDSVRKETGNISGNQGILTVDMIRRGTMKKALIISLLVIAVGLALNVQAANVTFEPQVVQLKVAPGEIGRTAIRVHGFSNSAYSLNFLIGSRIENGTIPRGWITAAYLWLDATAEGTSSAVMNLIISVPPDAKPGIYSSVLVPDNMRSSEAIVSPGVTVAIEVSDS